MAKKGVGNFTNQVTKELIKEQKRKLKEIEKQQKEDYIIKRYQEATTLTNEVAIYINKLNDTINSNCRDISIDEFINKDLDEIVLPERLLTAYIKPEEINIRKPNIIEKLFSKSKQEYKLYVKDIENKYKKEYALYEEKETNRKREIETLKKAHKLKITESINIKKKLYENKDSAIISCYKEAILKQIDYPFEFRKCINTGYCRNSNKLVIDYLLPDVGIVPNITRYEYKKTKDEIKPININEKERNNIYNQVIFSIVLNSISNIFKQDKHNKIDAIVFNGYIKDIDLATGQDISPYIISVIVDRTTFKSIDIKKINKLKCLKETMQGRIDISSSLYLKEITPIDKCDYLNKLVVKNESINLLEVDPFVLENLVATLFRKMGYDVIETKKTNDGGVDCELYNSDPIMGGKAIGQVKRYKNNIDIPKLREFESVLRNSDAMKGIFISTSNFSAQCEKFAYDNNISLINGSLLVDYFNQYGISSYILHK